MLVEIVRVSIMCNGHVKVGVHCGGGQFWGGMVSFVISQIEYFTNLIVEKCPHFNNQLEGHVNLLVTNLRSHAPSQSGTPI